MATYPMSSSHHPFSMANTNVHLHSLITRQLHCSSRCQLTRPRPQNAIYPRESLHPSKIFLITYLEFEKDGICVSQSLVRKSFQRAPSESFLYHMRLFHLRPLSWEKLRVKPATSALDKSFAALEESRDQFAR